MLIQAYPRLIHRALGNHRRFLFFCPTYLLGAIEQHVYLFLA